MLPFALRSSLGSRLCHGKCRQQVRVRHASELCNDRLGTTGCQVLSFHRKRGQSFLRTTALRGTPGSPAPRQNSCQSSPWTIDDGSARMGPPSKRPSRVPFLEAPGAFGRVSLMSRDGKVPRRGSFFWEGDGGGGMKARGVRAQKIRKNGLVKRRRKGRP